MTDVYAMEEDFEGALKAEFQALVERAGVWLFFVDRFLPCS